jgi:multiple sugar transport system permease protein
VWKTAFGWQRLPPTAVALGRQRTARRAVLRRGLIAVGAIALLLWTLLPLYVLVMVSVVDREELLNRPGHLFPQAPNLDQYRYLLKVSLLPPEGGFIATAGYNKLPLEGWVNSALVALAVVPLTLAIALPAAYAFSRFQFRYRLVLLTALVLTRAYPPVSVLLPFDYILTRLNLTGHLPAIAVSHLTLTIPLIAWIMSGFFAALPRNLEPAARIDGLTRFQALVKIVLPVSRHGLAAAAVIAFLTSWNEFFFALILANGTSAQTAPLDVQYSGAAYIVLSILPALALALLFQRSIRSLNIVDPL